MRTAYGTIILFFAAIWSPMVGKFGSIFSYVQDCWALMLAPCMGVFILAIFWKRTTNVAAISALFLAFPLLLVVFLREFYGILVEVNIFNLSAIAFIISLLVIVAISLVTKPKNPETIRTMIWRREMLKLPENGFNHYPFWKGVGFWFAVVVLCFVIIYIRFW
ncbi:MAG: hypothetical protein ACETVZ_04000 [Phycisphaerae bacterium]